MQREKQHNPHVQAGGRPPAPPGDPNAGRLVGDDPDEEKDDQRR